MSEHAPPPPLTERGERAQRLVDEMIAKAPFLRDVPMTGLTNMVAMVLKTTGETMTAAEEAIAKGKHDAGAILQWMLLGALATVAEGYPDDDARTALYRAGREVGEFWTERARQNVEAELAKKRH